MIIVFKFSMIRLMWYTENFPFDRFEFAIAFYFHFIYYSMVHFQIDVIEFTFIREIIFYVI